MSRSCDYRSSFPTRIPAAGDPDNYARGPVSIHELEDHWQKISPEHPEAAKKAAEELSRAKAGVMSGYENRSQARLNSGPCGARSTPGGPRGGAGGHQAGPLGDRPFQGREPGLSPREFTGKKLTC
jgi:hypothetical protein